MFKKLTILCIFILIIVMAGAVSASDDINSPDLQTADENYVEIKGVDSPGSFFELSDLVENANSSTALELEKDYKYDGSTPTTGIYLEKSVTVDGKGHILDACGQARIFNTTRSSTFKNIIFKNGYADGDGGISTSPYLSESVFINCTFINCHVTGSGGAIDGGNVVNSTFINCSADNSGGGTSGSWVSYSTFINCSAAYGGAMRGASASHCLFLNCTGEEGAVYYGIANACIETSQNFVKSDRKNSFDYIQELIDNAKSGDTVNISGYYSIYMSSIIIDKDITIQGNNAVLDGQGITRFFTISSGNVVLKNITMVNGHGSSSGGSILCPVYGDVNLKIEKCTFSNSSSGSAGSVIFFNGKLLNVVNSSFINCQAESQWANGAIYSYSSSDSLKVYNSTFINCSCTGRGGAIYNGYAYNCEFIKCVAGSYGGAIYAGYAENSRFIDCSARYGGGTSTTVAINSYFYHCTASNYGSAMDGGNATNCTFEYCSVWTNALSDVNAVNCSEYMYPLKESDNNYTFENIQKLIDNATDGDVVNLTGYYLGNGTQINVDKTLTFVGNNAILDAQGLSRIFNIDVDNVIFKNITFYHGYTTDRGGAIYSEYKYTVQNCTFIECMAPKSGAGAIYSFASDALAINSTFINCLAYQGGAIWFYYHSATAQNCTFINCYSNDCGGAMGSGRADNCTFINCSAGESGGAKYYGYVSYSKFINCTAGVDGGAAYDTEMCMNCEFINCNSKYGGALYKTDYENCIFTDCYPGLESDLYIIVYNIIKGEIANITVKANSAVTGNITLTVNNTDYKVNLTNGRGNVILSNLDLGTYSVRVVFSGDSVYQPSTKTGSFKVAYDSNLTADINDIFIDEIAVLNVSFNENITDKMRIYLDWNTMDFTINNGKIQLNLSDLSSGSHEIMVYFDGNDEFHSKSVDLLFNVYLHETEIAINLGEISQSGDVDVEIIISENVTGNITVQFDGANQNVEFTKGKATLSLHNIKDELHKVKVIYNGDWRFKPNNAVTFISTDLKLKDMINNTESSDYLTLKNNIIFTNQTDGNINIDKQITIDGGGHTIDANYLNKIFDVNANTVLKNIIFKNTQSSSEGGAIYSYGYNLQIINCTFINSKTTSNRGGAVYVNYGEIINSTFINCSSNYYGGAVYWFYSNSGYIINSTFINCSAENGGAIYSGSNKMNCTFINCSSNNGIVSGGWGTVYNSKFINPSVKNVFNIIREIDSQNCTFEVNPKLTINVGEIVAGSNAVIEVSINSQATGNVTFTIDNEEYPLEFTQGIASVTLQNIEFGTYNLKAVYGGDMYFVAQNITETVKAYNNPNLVVNFYNNYVDTNATANISINSDATGSIKVYIGGVEYNPTLSQGKASVTLPVLSKGSHQAIIIYSGDSNYISLNRTIEFNIQSNPQTTTLEDLINETSYGSTLTLTKDYDITSTIILNSAITIDGKGHLLDSKKVMVFDVRDNNVRITNTIFKNAYFNGYGGAISAGGYYFDCDNCTFINCSATYGGAIYASYGKISNCIFINCSADRGGAIRWEYSNRGSVYDCEFINCHAVNGGAIRAGNDVHNSKFISCSANNYGGAINGMTFFYDSVFEDCIANNGGAVYTSTSYNKQFRNITFNNCLAETNGGAIYIGGSSNVDVINSTFTGCSAENGDCIYVSGSESVIVTCTDSKFLSSRSTAFKAEYNLPTLINCTFAINPELKVSIENINAASALINISVNSEAKGNVTMKINNKIIDVTLNQGKTSITLTDLKSGDVIVVNFSGTDGYGNVSSNLMFTPDTNSSEDSGENNNSNQNTSNINNTVVNPPVTFEPKIIASDIQMLYSSDSTYVVKVYGTDGNLVSGVSVVFSINGKNVATAITNANGQASYKPTQIPGTYKITATALGVSTTNTLTVKQILKLKTVTVKKSAKKLVIQVSLSKVNGKYLKNKKITVKFNGKKYTAKTNSKGVAKVTVKKAVLKKLKVGKKVTYQATYLKNTVKKSVKVKK